MSAYAAPLKDMRFVLNELAGLAEVAKLLESLPTCITQNQIELTQTFFRNVWDGFSFLKAAQRNGRVHVVENSPL